MSAIDDFVADAAGRMEKSVESTHEHFNSVRTGRASAALLDRIAIDYYGTASPLKNIATINVPEPRLLTVKPWDKSQIKAVEKALRESDLGLNPQPDGDIIRLPLPPLPEERRKEFVKIARKYGEECKVTIRKARHEALDMLGVIDGDGGASADEIDRAKKKTEETVAESVKHVDTMIGHKEKDILEV